MAQPQQRAARLMDEVVSVAHSTTKGRAITSRLLHGVEFSAPWFSAHNRRGHTLAAAQTMEGCLQAAPQAASYRERWDRGLEDRWTAARTLDMFPDAAGGSLF